MRLETRGTLDQYRFYLETRYKTSISPVTATNYFSQAKQWARWCEENEVDYRKATQEDIAWHLGELRATKRQHTVRNRLICIRIFLDYCVFKKYREDNPARELPNTKAQSRPSEEFTQRELQGMYAACRDWRERGIYLLFLSGGLRRAEVFGVKRADVNFEAGTVMVLGKGSQYRLIAPGAMTMQALDRALEFSDRLCPWVWPNSVSDLVERLGKEAGVAGRVHCHRFRAHFASAFIRAGGNLDELAAILGHSTIQMSAFYARASQKQRAIETQARIDVAARALLEAPQIMSRYTA